MNPPAGYPHGSTDSRVQWLLRSFVAARRLGEVLGSSQGFDLPSGDTVEPDAAYVSGERWAAMPAPEEGKFLRVVPDLIVEILSRGSTASYDRGEKKAIYERNGVREYWILDTHARSLTRFFSEEGRFSPAVTFAAHERYASRILEGLEFAVAELFL
jgi:Uma2 family endonuclease